MMTVTAILTISVEIGRLDSKEKRENPNKAICTINMEILCGFVIISKHILRIVLLSSNAICKAFKPRLNSSATYGKIKYNMPAWKNSQNYSRN